MNIVNLVKNYLSNKSGNIAITFAFALLPLFMSIGAAVDYSRATALHSRIAQATDAALLASVAAVMENVNMTDTAAVNSKLNAEFEPFFLANMASAGNYQYNGYTLVFDPATLGVTVNVDADYNTAVFGMVGAVFGYSGLDIWETDVTAATGMQMKAGGAISMFLVLDRSSSMSNSNGEGGMKLDSLKIAVNNMTTNLITADPDSEFIRIGAVAYDEYMSFPENIDWDLNEANDYVQALTIGSGTDSSDAVEEAYIKLRNPSELTIHMAKNGQVPDLVMVFMTDGDNNISGADTDTLNTCNQAKSYGIEIFAIAFQAPSNGQALLASCASGPSNYFQPESTPELISAFTYIGANVAQKLILSQ